MLLLLNLTGWWKTFGESDLQQKITLFACFLGSGLNCIFYWQPHWLIFSKSAFSSFTDLFILWTFEKRNVSSEEILHNNFMPSFM